MILRDFGGDGRLVVLLHGLAGASHEWEGLALRLVPEFQVVAVDQRGHGLNERRPPDVSRAAYVADVVAVLDQLNHPSPVLVGQSLGGHTAMLTAARHSERVGALVLVEAGPGVNPRAAADVGGWLDSWPIPFPSRQDAARFFGGGPAGAGWAAGLEHRDGAWWPRFDRDVMVGSLAEITTTSFFDDWERITCPTLLVLAQSGLFSASAVAEILGRRPATTAVSIPSTGHDLHLERADALHAVLATFLREAGAEGCPRCAGLLPTRAEEDGGSAVSSGPSAGRGRGQGVLEP